MIRAASPADVPGIAQVHVDSWRETYTSILPQAFLDSLSVASREVQWSRSLASGNAVFVAEQHGETVGFSSSGPSRDPAYDGEIYTLYLLKRHQGTGLGRRLFQTSLEAQRSRGVRHILVWVLAANPTCGFYSHLGGVKTLEQPLEIGGITLPELGYVFSLTEETQ